MTAKLTLKVDADVIARAKRYAEARRTSVSRLVEGFLRFLTETEDAEAVAKAPVLRRLRGSLAQRGPDGDGAGGAAR
jgi:hypothetical protein